MTPPLSTERVLSTLNQDGTRRRNRPRASLGRIQLRVPSWFRVDSTRSFESGGVTVISYGRFRALSRDGTEPARARTPQVQGRAARRAEG